MQIIKRFFRYFRSVLPKNIDIKIQNIIFFIYTFSVPLFVCLKNIKLLRLYKNKYSGKRCFIIGNGPSLSATDLSLIKNEISFAANRIFYIFDKTEWRPTFYCLQDLNILKETGEKCLSCIERAEKAFFRLSSYNILKKWNWNLINIIFVPIFEKREFKGDLNFAFAPKPFIYDGQTVTYMAMQLAVYMGFTEIYLIGVDHSFPFRLNEKGDIEVIDKSLAAHFYETSKNNEGDEAYKRRSNNHIFVTKAYEAAEKASRQSGKFRIFNATRGGKLEVFERVKLEDVINGVKK